MPCCGALHGPFPRAPQDPSSPKPRAITAGSRASGRAAGQRAPSSTFPTCDTAQDCPFSPALLRTYLFPLS